MKPNSAQPRPRCIAQKRVVPSATENRSTVEIDSRGAAAAAVEGEAEAADAAADAAAAVAAASTAASASQHRQLETNDMRRRVATRGRGSSLANKYYRPYSAS